MKKIFLWEILQGIPNNKLRPRSFNFEFPVTFGARGGEGGGGKNKNDSNLKIDIDI